MDRRFNITTTHLQDKADPSLLERNRSPAAESSTSQVLAASSNAFASRVQEFDGSDCEERILKEVAPADEQMASKLQSLLVMQGKESPERISRTLDYNPSPTHRGALEEISKGREDVQQAPPLCLKTDYINGQGKPMPIRGGGGSLPHGPQISQALANRF